VQADDLLSAEVFDIEKIQDIKEHNNPLNMVRFDLGKEYIRDSMLAIVLDHPQNRPDFVQGKGEARVILLHGKITNDP